jgi:hypothetical protein
MLVYIKIFILRRKKMSKLKIKRCFLLVLVAIIMKTKELTLKIDKSDKC